MVLEGLDITSPGAASSFLNGGSNGMLVAFTDSRYCRLTRSRIHPARAGRRARLDRHLGGATRTTTASTTTIWGR